MAMLGDADKEGQSADQVQELWIRTKREHAASFIWISQTDSVDGRWQKLKSGSTLADNWV